MFLYIHTHGHSIAICLMLLLCRSALIINIYNEYVLSANIATAATFTQTLKPSPIPISHPIIAYICTICTLIISIASSHTLTLVTLEFTYYSSYDATINSTNQRNEPMYIPDTKFPIDIFESTYNLSYSLSILSVMRLTHLCFELNDNNDNNIYAQLYTNNKYYAFKVKLKYNNQITNGEYVCIIVNAIELKSSPILLPTPTAQPTQAATLTLNINHTSSTTNIPTAINVYY